MNAEDIVGKMKDSDLVVNVPKAECRGTCEL